MMPDYPLGETLDFKFTTRSFSTGAPTSFDSAPVVDIYEDNSITQITTAETLTVDFDSITGLNNLRIVATSGNGFESGKSYAAVISTGTVDGVSVVGEVVAQFSIERSPALRPTTAGRTLDVTATGAAGIDWGNVENQNTSVDLSATSTNLVDTATAVTNDVGVNEWNGVSLGTTNPLPNAAAGAAGGLPTDSAGKTSFNDPTAATIADSVWDEDATAHQTQGTFGQAIGDPGADADTIWSLVNTNLNATISSRSSHSAADVWTNGTRTLTANTNLNDPTAAAIADAVWDEDIVAAHGTSDTAGLIISQLTSRAVTFNTAVDDTSILGQMADDGTATFDRTTDSLQAIADSGGSGPSAETIADAVWDEVLDSAHEVAGSASVLVQDILDDTGTTGVAIASNAISAGTIVASALDGKGDWNINKTGYSISGTKTTLDALNDITTTQVNTEVDTALSDIFLDRLFATNYDPAAKPGTATALLNELIENDGGVSRYTANALEQAPTGGSAPTVAQIADGVWDEVLDSAHSVADSAGQKVKDILTDTANMNGSDGVTLATSQPNYAPAVAGNAMDLIANAVDSTSMADNTITANKIATDAITNTKIAANAIGSSELATDAITNAQIAPNAIGSSELATDAITSAQLANSAVDEIWQTTLTESYAADGAEGTATQILYAMQQFMLDADYTGTTLTVRRLNGTSQAYVITVDDATTPTDKNRTA